MDLYYKVVRNVSGQYYSSQINQQFQVEYLVDAWVEPALGKAFLFKTKAAAEAFVGASAGDLEIWECTAKNVTEAQVVLTDTTVNNASDSDLRSLDALRDYWDNREYEYGASRTMRWDLPPRMRPPEGTLIADAVMILRVAP